MSSSSDVKLNRPQLQETQLEHVATQCWTFLWNSHWAFVMWNFHHFVDKLVVTGRFGDSCRVWTSPFRSEILSFLTSGSVFSASLCLQSIFPFLPLCGGGWRGEEDGGGGGRVMGGGLLPSICCDGRLGSPEGASAWPDRNHHWSVWHQASPQLRVLIGLLVDPRESSSVHAAADKHTQSPLCCPDFMFLCCRVYASDNTQRGALIYGNREDDGKQSAARTTQIFYFSKCNKTTE